MSAGAPRMAAPDVPAALGRRVRLRTRWSDEDLHGVLNNAVYLTLLEEARLEYFSALDAMDGARFPFVLAQANVLFLRPGRGGAEVEVEIGTLHVGRSSIHQAYRVRDLDTGEVWCEAVARLVATDAAGGKVEVPGELRAKLERLEGLGSDA